MLPLFLGKALFRKWSYILISENRTVAKFLCICILGIEFLTLSMPWNSVLIFIVFLLSLKTYAHILWISHWKVLIIHEAVYNEIFIVCHWYISVKHRRSWKDGREAPIFFLVIFPTWFINDVEGISCWILNSKHFWFRGTQKFIWEYLNIFVQFKIEITQ